MIDAALWTILPISLIGVTCAWLGCWLVLMKGSMAGDGISHSILPGLVIVFMLFGTRAPGPMLVGAIVAALLTVALTHGLTTTLGIQQDAALGAVFTTFFAAGVLMLQRVAPQIDLDPGCVLYGLAEYLPLDSVRWGSLEVPRALEVILPLSAVVWISLAVLRRELTLAIFDPRHAASIGRSPHRTQFALMVLVAVAVVSAFEWVGAILVLALLVGPAATAQLLTRRLQPMLILSAVLAIAASIGGYFAALATSTSVSGMIAVVLGLFYAFAALLSQRRARRVVSTASSSA